MKQFTREKRNILVVNNLSFKLQLAEVISDYFRKQFISLESLRDLVKDNLVSKTELFYFDLYKINAFLKDL